MSTGARFDAWNAGQNYELYMGRWSRRMAARFVDWLAPPKDAAWIEVGCGTGALTGTILAECAPRSLLAIDASASFLEHARSTVVDGHVRFEVADALALPAPDASTDVVASALVLNFIPDRRAALVEMQRVLKPDGQLAFYVWDYPGGGIGFIRAFWTAAIALDPDAAELGEDVRFPFCSADGLLALCLDAGMQSPVIEPLEIETVFADFQAFWQPFTLGSGPAPGYCARLTNDQRAELKARLASTLGTMSPIRMVARAWAVRAEKTGR